MAPRKLLVIPAAAIGFSGYFVWEKYFKDSGPYHHHHNHQLQKAQENFHEVENSTIGESSASESSSVVNVHIAMEEGLLHSAKPQIISILEVNREASMGFIGRGEQQQSIN